MGYLGAWHSPGFTRGYFHTLPTAAGPRRIVFMRWSEGETRGNDAKNAPPSCRDGVTHPHTYRGSHPIPCCSKSPQKTPVTATCAHKPRRGAFHAVPLGRHAFLDDAFPGFHPGLFSFAAYGSRSSAHGLCALERGFYTGLFSFAAYGSRSSAHGFVRWGEGFTRGYSHCAAYGSRSTAHGFVRWGEGETRGYSHWLPTAADPRRTALCAGVRVKPGAILIGCLRQQIHGARLCALG